MIVYLLQWNPVGFEWVHLYLWQVLIMLDGLIVYLLWVRMLPLKRPAQQSSASVATS